jgi:hypothetical protein
VLARFFGTNVIAVEAHREGTPGWTCLYPSFWAIADKQASSRIYGGIHLYFDRIVGQEIGIKVGHYLVNNFMLPRNRMDIAATNCSRTFGASPTRYRATRRITCAPSMVSRCPRAA